MAGAILLPFGGKKLKNPEFGILCGAAVAGFLCYAMQAKGYAYQRYPFALFLLLLLGLVFMDALQSGMRWQRWTAIAALGAGCMVIGPLAAKRAVAYRPQEDQFGSMLSADLRTLGVNRLRGNVQCLDTYTGCLRVLYDLRLKESSSTLYDEFLFSPTDGPVITRNRSIFAEEISVHPPEAIVMTPQYFSGSALDYNKVWSWPWFARYLSANYVLYAERTPTRAELWEGAPRVPTGYRIYLRRDTLTAGR